MLQALLGGRVHPAVVADAFEPFWQGVLQHFGHELVCPQGLAHTAFGVVGGVTVGDSFCIAADELLVANRALGDVTGEVADDFSAAANMPDVNTPGLMPYARWDAGVEVGALFFDGLLHAHADGALQGKGVEQIRAFGAAADVLPPPVQLALALPWHFALLFPEHAAGHDVVDVWMVAQITLPGLQRTKEPGLPTEVFSLCHEVHDSAAGAGKERIKPEPLLFTALMTQAPRQCGSEHKIIHSGE